MQLQGHSQSGIKGTVVDDAFLTSVDFWWESDWVGVRLRLRSSI